jgi:hypothetical protein
MLRFQFAQYCQFIDSLDADLTTHWLTVITNALIPSSCDMAGIPDMRPLENGDLVSIDISCYVDGHHGDCCGTFIAGEPTPEGRKSRTQ